MKKIIVIILLGFAFNVNAQTSQQDTLPTSIKDDFSAKFADVSALEWEVADSIYTATFTMDGERHLIEYNPSGKVLNHQYTLKESQYPSAVSDMIKKDFSTHKVRNVDSVEKDGIITYEVKLKGEPNYKVVFDSTGKVLSKKQD